MLQLKNISYSYSDSNVVLDNCSFRLNPGEVYTLAGRRGVGKTTLFNIITRFLKPDNGNIYFNGVNIKGLSPFEVSGLGICRTFQDTRLITSLTVREHIILSLKNKSSEDILHLSNTTDSQESQIQQIAEANALTSVLGKRTGELPYSMQKLLEFVCCTEKNAKLLLLDEPTNGVDEDCLNVITQRIGALKMEGKSFLIIDRNIDFLHHVADKILCLSNGCLTEFSAANGSTNLILRNYLAG